MPTAMHTPRKPKKAIKIVGFIGGGSCLLFMGFVFYHWTTVLKPYADKLEAPRVPLLRKVAAAQTRFRSQDLDRDGVYDFATLDELIKARLLHDREVQKAGIVFIEPALSAPRNRWWAVAEPLHPFQGRAFFINQSGVIYYTSGGLGLAAKMNRNSAEVPVGARIFDKK